MKNKNKVAVIGAKGYVGRGMMKIFPDAYQFDLGLGSKGEVNENCELAIVCVPTPSRENGSCDISIVEEVVSWLATPLILIKSAIEPGAAAYLSEKYNKKIVVSPEYMGEGKYWTPPKYPDPQNPITHGFVVLGGPFELCSRIADIFTPVLGPATRFRFVSAIDAETIKYAENAWGMIKVMFANQLRNFCEAAGANWHMVREGWLDDPRVEPMHTAVFANKRGFGGRCFPKDTKAFVHIAKVLGVDLSIIQAGIEANKRYEDPSHGT